MKATKKDSTRATTEFCTKCGEKNDLSHYGIHKTDWCFGCNFWQKIVSKKSLFLIIDGQSYGDGGDQPKEINLRLLGHGGRRFYIRRSDESVLTTNNLWSQGPIPEAWRDQLPDNAEFITKADFEEATKDVF